MTGISLKLLAEPNSDSRKDILVMGYANKGSLLDFLKKGAGMDERMEIAKQIVEAVGYIHKNKLVAHRDIKLDNILISQQENEKLVAFLSDFGFALKYSSEGTKISERR